ncbi:hypothetical protein H0H81_006847 [Sphagnurus paluster]|uniref:Uncharacterized protein n=1 Tax=Sphagnurus paluster TaxID=117069 RepID=A0A9P7KGH5_9AGAR|nr:hypothetical protein H0H81_006847 [Sphagnurus paluster]
MSNQGRDGRCLHTARLDFDDPLHLALDQLRSQQKALGLTAIPSKVGAVKTRVLDFEIGLHFGDLESRGVEGRAECTGDVFVQATRGHRDAVCEGERQTGAAPHARTTYRLVISPR